MKKRLEAELISIAHRILKLKNKSELVQLHSETRKLYETLSVLKFVEENMNIVQPKINVDDVEQKLEKAFDKKEKKSKTIENPVLSEHVFEEVNNDTEPELKENFSIKTDDVPEIEAVSDQSVTETEEVPTEIFSPAFELQKEEEVEQELEIENKNEPAQISFSDLLGQNYAEPVFEKVSDKTVFDGFESNPPTEEIVEPVKAIEVSDIDIKTLDKEELSEKSSTGINFGLNDRIGFEKQLFDGSSEDMNRVISQLSTFNSLQEAKDFIQEMVKPDYNDWKGKEDYEERFMEVISKKFL